VNYLPALFSRFDVPAGRAHGGHRFTIAFGDIIVNKLLMQARR
jgi:hypothetical protein